MKILTDIFDNPFGRILISILLGLGLASLFRQVCSGSKCIVIKGPSMQDTEKYYYKIDDDCYKYTPVASKCDGDVVEEKN